MIEVAAGNKFSLKVLTFDGQAVYEKLLDEVIDCWMLTVDSLFYQQRYADNMITYVKLSTKAEEVQVKHFKLPADVVIKDHITASMEPFVEAHPSEDKQALRNLIKKEVDGAVREPVIHMMASIDDKVSLVCENEVLYFRPDKIIEARKKAAEGEEEAKDATNDTI